MSVHDDIDAELGRELRRQLGRIRKLIDDGKVDDPAVVAFVRSLEERLEAGGVDEITEAQLARLVELSQELLGTFGP